MDQSCMSSSGSVRYFPNEGFVQYQEVSMVKACHETTRTLPTTPKLTKSFICRRKYAEDPFPRENEFRGYLVAK